MNKKYVSQKRSPLLITKEKDFFTRIPIALLIIGLMAGAPFIVGLSGAWLTEVITGEPCHEGNCFWMALPWLCMLTFPIAGVCLIVLPLLVIRDSILLFKKK